ncbi:hypothetical protein D9M69_676220 [compost metagenome]
MGMIRKFWNTAIWSNFSAQSPAMRPSVPSMAEPSSANTRIHTGATKLGTAKKTVTANTPTPTASPRITEEPT